MDQRHNIGVELVTVVSKYEGKAGFSLLPENRKELEKKLKGIVALEFSEAVKKQMANTLNKED